jgi:hypothetical protein
MVNKEKWAILDSNQRPQSYQDCALTSWANRPEKTLYFTIDWVIKSSRTHRLGWKIYKDDTWMTIEFMIYQEDLFRVPLGAGNDMCFDSICLVFQAIQSRRFNIMLSPGRIISLFRNNRRLVTVRFAKYRHTVYNVNVLWTLTKNFNDAASFQAPVEIL